MTDVVAWYRETQETCDEAKAKREAEAAEQKAHAVARYEAELAERQARYFAAQAAEKAAWAAKTADEILETLARIDISVESAGLEVQAPGYEDWCEYREICEAAGVTEAHADAVAAQAEAILARLGGWMTREPAASVAFYVNGCQSEERWLTSVGIDVPPNTVKKLETKVRERLARILADHG